MNVLIVDDDDAIRTLVVRVFARRGNSVQSAPDGEAAIACLESHDFDLVVLDLMMPRTDGFGVLSYLAKRNAARPRIIVMTAAVPLLVAQVPKELVVGVIAKPFDLAALLDMAEEALGPEVAAAG
jgi:CheY-like chemotaxis protein